MHISKIVIRVIPVGFQITSAVPDVILFKICIKSKSNSN